MKDEEIQIIEKNEKIEEIIKTAKGLKSGEMLKADISFVKYIIDAKLYYKYIKSELRQWSDLIIKRNFMSLNINHKSFIILIIKL